MAYEKRLCVLKQIKKGFSADGKPLSGAIHAERLGETLTLTLRLLDFAPVKEGRYALAVKVEKKTYLFDIGEGELRVENCPSLKDGFSVLVCFIRAEIEPVAFGFCGGASNDYIPLLNALSMRGEDKKKKQSKKKEEFNDEAIAEDNYYEREKNTGKSHENETSALDSKGAKEEEKVQSFTCVHDGDESENLFLFPKKDEYYQSIKERLERAFSKYPSDERYKEVFPTSKWVNAEGTLLGIIYEGNVPLYLCVATKEPPEEKKEGARFVPFHPFLESDGMYVLFQSAQTGEVVFLSDL